MFPESVRALLGFGNLLTHRCHNRDFLLKFSRDKKRWLHWLFEAKKRCGPAILDYVVTSNHLHLLVYDDGREEVIPRSIFLAASREDNVRKGRSGAFWEDHYHAAGGDTNEHLVGGDVFVSRIKERFGVCASSRDVIEQNGCYALREGGNAYMRNFEAKNVVLSNSIQVGKNRIAF